MKYVMPFIDMKNWEHNSDCSLCKQIDDKLNHILDKQIIITDAHDESTIEYNTKLINEVEPLLVDGYGILDTFEKCNKDFDTLLMLQNNDTNILQKYLAYINTFAGFSFTVNKRLKNENQYTDMPLTLYSRWCKKCGARKLDIYDTIRSESLALLPIININFTLNNNQLNITWQDSNANYCHTSYLHINDKVYGPYKYNEHILKPAVIPIEDNIIYSIYIVNYDTFNKEIVRSPLKIFLNETNNKPIIRPIKDTQVLQETKLVKDKINNNWIRKRILHILFTPTTEKTIVRRSLNMIENPESYHYGNFMNGEPQDINFGIPCNIPNQIIDDNDYRIWIIKPFPVSKTYGKKENNIITFYEEINNNSNAVVVPILPLGPYCSYLRVKNFSHRVEIKWQDAYKNWKETRLYIKEYDGIPIRDQYEGKLIFTNTEENKYHFSPYEIRNLENGKKYQLGIFSVTQDDIVMIDPKQLILEPKYIRNSHYINEEFINKHNIQDFKEVHEITPNKIQEIDKSLYEYKNIMRLGKFKWENEQLITYEEAIMWFETQYPVEEGGILKFEANSLYPCQINIYINYANMFSINIQPMNIINWEKYQIDIPRMHYCKIILEVKCKYKNRKVSLRNMVFHYNTGEEKFI